MGTSTLKGKRERELGLTKVVKPDEPWNGGRHITLENGLVRMNQGDSACYPVSAVGKHHLGASVWDKSCKGKCGVVWVVLYRRQVDVARSNEYIDGIVNGVGHADELLSTELLERGHRPAVRLCKPRLFNQAWPCGSKNSHGDVCPPKRQLFGDDHEFQSVFNRETG